MARREHAAVPADDMSASALSALSVVLFGDLLVDRTIVVDTFPRRGQDSLIVGSSEQAGGCCLNVAMTLANLGDRPRLVSRVGADPAGDAILAYLQQVGIDSGLVQQNADWITGHTYAVVDASGERTFMTRRPSSGEQYCDVRLDTIDPAGVYVTGYALRSPRLADWVIEQVRVMRAGGATVVFDPGPLIATTSVKVIARMVSMSDWCVPNEAELELIGAQPGIRHAPVEWMHGLGCSYVVVKRGEGGADVFAATGHQWRTAATKVDVVDTNGAGDAFVGGLIHGVLHQLDIQANLELAAACGSMVAMIHGSHGRFTRSELDHLMFASEPPEGPPHRPPHGQVAV